MAKTELLSFRLDSKKKAFLTSESDKLNLSVSAFLNKLIDNYIEDNPQTTKSQHKEKLDPPTLKEAIDYFKANDSNSDEATVFFYYFSSKNWYSGKTKIRNWKIQANLWIASKKLKENDAKKREKEKNWQNKINRSTEEMVNDPALGGFKNVY